MHISTIPLIHHGVPCSITGGGGGGGNWGGDKELQETPDTVFITGLSQNIVEEDLTAHFGSIGIIKVWIHLNLWSISNLTITTNVRVKSSMTDLSYQV